MYFIFMLQLTDTWHVAYFTTHVGNIRRILDLGEVILPGNMFLFYEWVCIYFLMSLHRFLFIYF